nr:hypothetical protein [uncultured Carboxylicivirga sp.]
MLTTGLLQHFNSIWSIITSESDKTSSDRYGMKVLENINLLFSGMAFTFMRLIYMI